MLTKVESSLIWAVGYDRETRVLTVRLKPEGVYSYEDVPPEIFDELLASPSKGRFYTQKIRGKYKIHPPA